MAEDELIYVLSALANARAQVYTLLSLGFRAPAAELVAGLWDGAFPCELKRALQASQAPLPGDLRTLVGESDLPTAGALAHALRLEHTRFS